MCRLSLKRNVMNSSAFEPTYSEAWKMRRESGMLLKCANPAII